MASNQTVAAFQPQQLHTDFALLSAAAANGANFANTSSSDSNVTQNFENEDQQEELVEDAAVKDKKVLVGSGEYNLVGIR